MSAITGISSSMSSKLLEQLQLSVRQRSESGSAASTQTAQAGGYRRAQFESILDDALGQAGLDDSQMDDVKSEIQQAVSSAISNSDTSADPRNAVDQAIEGVLQKHGVDTDALKEQMKSRMGSMQGPPPGGPGGPGGAGGPGNFKGKISEALTAAGADSSKLDEITSAIDTAVTAAKENEKDGSGANVKLVVHEVLNQYGIDQDAFDKAMEAGRDSRSERMGAMGGWQGTPTVSGSADSNAWLAGLMQLVDEQA